MTSKSVVGILFILLLLTDKSVLKRIFAFRTLILLLAWLIFCFPLADADYQLERYLYNNDEKGTYGDILEQHYYLYITSSICLAVRLESKPDQYQYFYCWPFDRSLFNFSRQSSALEGYLVPSNIRRIIRPIPKIVFNEEAFVRQTT